MSKKNVSTILWAFGFHGFIATVNTQYNDKNLLIGFNGFYVT